jgi:hypothetical protein
MTNHAAHIGRSTFIAALALLSACSSESEPNSSGSGGQPAAGGSTATGGKSAVTGGTSAATGGSVTATGGTTGGSSTATGGTATGGSMSGAGGRANDGGSGGSTGGSAGKGTGGGSSGAGGSPGGAGGAGAGAGAGGAATAGSGGSGGSVGGGAGGSPLAPVTDYAAPGPFKTSTQAGTGPDGTYTVIRPATLGTSFLYAPITFGPGTGMEVSQLSGLLERIASHGFVVIGRQLTGGPGDAVTRMRMTAGLDWIIAQNTVAGSVFEGKIDVKRAVAMGYSVGGTGAVEVGEHDAIATVVSIHGHQAKADLHAPLLLIGGTEDVMGDDRSWLAPTYDDSQVQTFFGTVVGANHGYIQGTVNGVPGGVETPAMIAWLRYWIYNDQGAKNYFYGDDCVMCRSPWTNPQRKNWQ